MKFDIDNVKIEIPNKPTQEWENRGTIWQSYRILAKLDDKKIGHLTMDRVSRIMPGTEMDGDTYFLNRDIEGKYTSSNPEGYRPWIMFRETESGYSGKGLQRKLIVETNKFAKEKWNTPLHSGTTVIEQFKDKVRGTWNHLVEEGKAFKYEVDEKVRYGMF